MRPLRRIATGGHPTLCQSFDALTETLVPSMKSVNLSVAVLYRFCTCSLPNFKTIGKGEAELLTIKKVLGVPKYQHKCFNKGVERSAPNLGKLLHSPIIGELQFQKRVQVSLFRKEGGSNSTVIES